MKKKIEKRHIFDILTNISLKQEEEKEQLPVTSTGTPAEEREEEKREGNYQVIRIRDDTSKIVYPKNYRHDVFQVLPSGIAGRFCPTTA
jgi:hypothetical protein